MTSHKAYRGTRTEADSWVEVLLALAVAGQGGGEVLTFSRVY